MNKKIEEEGASMPKRKPQRRKIYSFGEYNVKFFFFISAL